MENGVKLKLDETVLRLILDNQDLSLKVDMLINLLIEKGIVDEEKWDKVYVENVQGDYYFETISNSLGVDKDDLKLWVEEAKAERLAKENN